MKASTKAIDLIKQFEGCVLTPYKDVGGVWTVGYGTTGAQVKQGVPWTQAQAEEALQKRVDAISSILTTTIVPIITQNQLDALTSLCYNIGQGAFRQSTCLRFMNQRQFAAAADQFLKWDHVNGVVVPGLLNRRQAERALFLA